MSELRSGITDTHAAYAQRSPSTAFSSSQQMCAEVFYRPDGSTGAERVQVAANPSPGVV